MSERSKSRNEQRNGKTQKPKIAASEATVPVKRDEAPIAPAPKALAPETPAPKTPAPKTPAPKATPPAPQPPRLATSPGKPAPKATPPAPQPPRAAAAAAPPPQPRPYALDRAVDTMERSLKAAGQVTLAVNRKLIDFAQANVNSGLDHVKDLAAARNPVRIMRLQMDYWHDCLATFASQAQELRALSAELVAKTNEPIRRHVLSFPARAA